LLVVVLAPGLVATVAFAFGSLIFHADQLRGSVAGYGLLILGVVALAAGYSFGVVVAIEAMWSYRH
jgi:hypothetical protein